MNTKGKHKHGMKVPEGYFASIEERLASRLSEEKLPQTTGFETPSGYFDQMEDRMLKKAKEDQAVKVIPFYRRKAVLYAASIAACLLLSVSIFYPSEIDQETLNLAELEAYIEAGNIAYDMHDIAQILTDVDLETLPSEDMDVSLENLEDYLLENLDDTNLLIE